MRTLWRGIVRTVFWSYERGSWPYDLMVIAIVVFVLLTPRRWFHDQPRTNAFAEAAVQLVSTDAAAQTRTYRLSVAAIPTNQRATQPSAELDSAIHDVLAHSVNDLQDGAFTVQQVNPILSADGTVIAYNVTTHP